MNLYLSRPSRVDGEKRDQERPMWTPEAQQRRDGGGPARHASVDGSCTILDLISSHAVRKGEATALRQGRESLRYGQLDALSNQIARYLMRRGIGVDSRVAVFMERTLRLPATILGILKTGAAWVPLDPNYPADRLQYMVEDCRAALLITERALAGRLQTAGTPVCDSDLVWAEIEREDPTPPPTSISPSSTAYVIYTSGTTGRPKGVLIEHRNLGHYVQALGRALGVTGQDVYLHTASFAFSSSVRQLMLPLSLGAEVVLAQASEINDPLRLFGVIAECGVTIIDLVPTYWAACITAIEGAPAPEREKLLSNRLRLVLSASEALWSHVPRRWRELAGPSVKLINMFGQTETCGIVATYPIPESMGLESRIMPAGKPIAGMRIYVLDSNGQPVPNGGSGEVYVAGPSVGPGYLGLEKLTRERFLDDPFHSDERMYRTGDLGRLTPAGDLEFLGRQDSQIKIRGHRIELGEIEAALRGHPSVSEAVVVPRDFDSGDRQLVAYFTVRSGASVAVQALREHLRNKLPGYMVPSAMVRLDRLPLTPNGKLDRKSLPAPEQTDAEQTEGRRSPQNETERLLCKLWASVLNRREVGVEENFFDLGGHSILAVALFTKIRSEFGVDLPLASLLKAPTVAAMAQLISKGHHETDWNCLVPIRAEGDRPPFYCIHAVGGNIVEFYHLAQRMPPNQPFIGIQASGLDGRRTVHASVEEAAAEYIREIKRFQPDGPYHLGGSSFGGLVAFEMARQLHAAGERVGLVALFDTYAPGYPKLLPEKARWRANLEFVWWRAKIYARDFRMLRGRQRYAYATEKMKHTAAKVWRKSRRRMRRFREAVDRLFLPKVLRDLERTGKSASRRYVPRIYPGKITLFRATRLRPGVCFHETNGFEGLASGGVEVHPVEGSHGFMVREPQVNFLAPVLCECLERAQREHGQGGGSKRAGERTPEPRSPAGVSEEMPGEKLAQ